MIKLTREHFTLELCGTSYYLYCRLQEDTNEGIEVCIEPLFGGYYVALYELSSRILIMEKDYLKWSGQTTPEAEQKLVEMANKQVNAYMKFIHPTL